MDALNVLWRGLKPAGIEDQTVFVSHYVFGRSLIRNSLGGRSHNGDHHCMLTFGASTAPGVIGGIEANTRNGRARSLAASSISSITGRSVIDGDISKKETLASVGKTLIRSLGISAQIIEECIHGGKIIKAVLN